MFGEEGGGLSKINPLVKYWWFVLRGEGGFPPIFGIPKLILLFNVKKKGIQGGKLSL